MVLALVLAAGCSDSKKAQPAPAPSASRFEAVAKKTVTRSPEAFCDTYTPGDDAKSFTPPPLADGATFPDSGWRWINLWATWCQPCREEMPLLVDWKDELTKKGAHVSLVFVSLDNDDQTVADFRKKNPQTPESLRIGDMKQLPSFLSGVGLGENTPIPIQIFVDPANKVRCVRAGAVSQDDYSAVEKILL